MSQFTKIQLQDIAAGHDSYIGPFHDLQVAWITRLVGTNFTGTTKDTNFWTESVTGSGTVSQASGALTLATGVTANSTVQYQSVRTARFIAKQTNIYRAVMKLGDTGTANNIRNWGAFDANNGAFFQLNGTTLNVVTRAAGSDTAVAKASWNKNNTFTLDTNYHAYEIHMGYTHFMFYIDNTLVHVIDIIGTATLPAQTLVVPSTMQNNNSGGGTANVNMVVTVASIFRLGQIDTQPIAKNIAGAATNTLKFGAGFLHNIIINAGPNGTITIFDNTTNSGTIIGTPTVSGATATPTSLEFHCPFFNGLTIVTSAATNITVIYE